MRNQAEETAKQAAYEAGQTSGYSNKVYQNPFDGRTQDAQWCAFADGYEDGRNQYASEAQSAGASS